jgi:hypothetical protein
VDLLLADWMIQGYAMEMDASDYDPLQRLFLETWLVATVHVQIYLLETFVDLVEERSRNCIRHLSLPFRRSTVVGVEPEE